MIGARVDLQLSQLLRPSRLRGSIPRTASRITSSGPALEHLAEGARPQPARIAAVAVVELRVALVAGDPDLLGVDDDHEVACVDVRRVLGLALAAQRVRDLGRQPAEGLALGVDDVPVALAGLGCGDEGLHRAEKPRTNRRATARRRMIVERGRAVRRPRRLISPLRADCLRFVAFPPSVRIVSRFVCFLCALRRRPSIYCRAKRNLPNPSWPCREGAGEPKGLDAPGRIGPRGSVAQLFQREPDS